jgi:hypothetical protein
MDDAPAGARPARGPAGPARRFKARHLDLGDGSRLTLHPDGAIDHVDATGEVVASWALDDPDWPRHAIRFGLRPQPATVAPHGGPAEKGKPPGW